jgi:hypothetical protein
LLCDRRDDRGPIFHAKTSKRKDRGASTLCVTLPRVMARRTYGQDFTPDLFAKNRKM